jgi:hypothetical protein
MADLAALRAVWPEQGLIEEKLAHVNTLMSEGPTVDVSIAAIKECLAPRMAHLECFALAAKTRDLRRRLHMSGIPQSVVSATYLLQILGSGGEQIIGKYRLPVLKNLLDDLVSDEASGISRELADEVIALSSSTMPWWLAHKFSAPVGVYDAIEAGVSQKRRFGSMFGGSGSTMALPNASDLSALGALLELVRDPKKSAEVVSQLTAAAKKNEEALAAMRRERSEWDAAQRHAKESIERERKEHDAQLERERAVWKAEQTKRLAEIEGWEKQAKASLEKAEKDGKAAAALKRDLEQRLARLHELAA